jgi:C-terminal peptidase prc
MLILFMFKVLWVRDKSDLFDSHPPVSPNSNFRERAGRDSISVNFTSSISITINPTIMFFQAVRLIKGNAPLQCKCASPNHNGLHGIHNPEKKSRTNQPTFHRELPSIYPPLHLDPIKRSLTASSLAIVASLATLITATPLPALAVTQEQLLFLDAWRAVDRAYVDKTFNGQNWFKKREDFLKKVPMSNRIDTYKAIRSLLSSLDDPFTRLLIPDQYAALASTTSGSGTGIGVEVSFNGNGELVVVAPTPDGPAEAAGIRPGDEIVEIDGKKTNELSLYAIGGMLQGPLGTQIQLKILSSSSTLFNGSIKGSEKELTLTRAAITYNPVDAAVCSRTTTSSSNDKQTTIGYIRIATFSSQTPDRALEAIQSLKKGGVDKFVLDLRNNGGGSFPAGVKVAQMWIPKGDIVLIADAQGVKDVYEAQGRAEEPSIPLTVLVNRGTASASEVLSGALKDNKRGVIVGERTFGKGLIQTLVPLSDGSAVAVTVAKYQTPSGIDINKIGITPDVKLSTENLASVPLNGKAFCAAMATMPDVF